MMFKIALRYGTRALYLLCMSLAASALATPPNRINYQGIALDPNGSPLQGSQNVDLRVWNDPLSSAAGALIYAEQHASVSFLDGVFSLSIGSGTPTSGSLSPDAFSQPERWLEIQVGTEVLAPRQRLDSVAYALQCGNSDSVGGLPASTLITGVSAGTGLSGGGSSGDVSLSLAASGVGSAQIADGSITSADIAANTITGPDIAFSSISSALVADDSLFEQDLANEAGVDFSSTRGDIALDALVDTIVASATIDAPTAGFIIANASVQTRISGIGNTLPAAVSCSLTLDSPTMGTSVIIESNPSNDTVSTGVALTEGFSVSGPGLKVVRVICARGLGGVTVGDRRLTAIFAPTRY